MRRRTVVGTLGSLSIAGCLRLTSEETSGSDSQPPEEGYSDSNDGENERADSGEDLIWVAPEDGDSGDGTRADPIRDVQHALNIAEPGDTIRLKSGEYQRNINTTNGGEPGNPITLTGPRDAVIRPEEGGTTMFRILYSHFHIKGITFDGLVDPDRKWEDKKAWTSNILTVSPGPRHEEGVDYIEDVVFEPHRVGNAGDTFVRLERTRNATLGDFEVFGPVGAAYHPQMEDPIEGHFGSFFYVGTSPPHVDNRPWDTLDRSRDIRIHHVDNSAGYHHSRFASLRAGTENVTIEYCTVRNAGNETSGREYVPAIEVEGNNCTIRGNDIGDCRQGILFGAWTPTELADADDWARNNDVYTNRLQGIDREVFVFRDSAPEAQRVMCDNRLVGVDSDEYDYATGECNDVPEVDGIGYTAGQ